MRIGRTLPPAAAPLCWRDLRHAAAGVFSPARNLRAREQEIRRDLGVQHVFLVSSGTAAVTLTLKALKSLSRRTEVVIPAYTCFSVPAAVMEAGLRPVLCDIDPSTFDFDHSLLERAVGADTLCVLGHHLFGVPSDIERIRALCSGRGVFVVEDAAQAMGAEDRGRRLGTLGDVGIFSLGRGKNITCGSGGIMVTNSDELAGAMARECRRLAAPGPAEQMKDLLQLVLMAVFIRPRLYWIPAVLPFLRLGQTIYPRQIRMRRLSGMQAGLLRNWRRRLSRSNRIRSETSTYFSHRLPFPPPAGPAHPFLRLPVLAKSRAERDRIYALSQRRGLGLAVAYPTPINEIPEIRRAFDGQRFPAAQRVAECLLTIPTHHWLSDEDKRAIADCVGTMANAIEPSGGAWRRAS
jgi:dTDP-4-amino-4,6-dideoxygalactose transaminase